MFAEGSDYRTQSVELFLYGPKLCQNRNDQLNGVRIVQDHTDKDILDESYYLVKHFSDFPSWE